MAKAGLAAKDHVEVRLGGFGGQGIILAASILGRAVTVHAGRNAVMSQSYGPESRGGACMAEVVIADGEIAYPRVTDPDLLVLMSRQAYDRYGLDRPAGSTLIVDEDLVELDGGSHDAVLAAPATRLAEELGRRLVANIVMLGFISGATGVVDLVHLREAVVASVPRGTEQLNLAAVTAGYEHALGVMAGPSGDGPTTVFGKGAGAGAGRPGDAPGAEPGAGA